MFENFPLTVSVRAYLLWLLFLAIAIVVTRRCIGYKRFNTFTIYLPWLILTNGLLTPLGIDASYSVITASGLSDLALRRTWLSVGLMYATMPLGVIAANSFRRRSPSRSGDAIIRQTARSGPLMWFIGFTCVLSLVSLVQIYIDGIQLDIWRFFTGFETALAYADHRYTFAEATTGWQYYLYTKLPYGIAPMAMILLWNHEKVSRNIRYLAIGVMTFALIQTGHKLPLVMIGMTLIVSRYLIRYNMAVPMRAMVFAAAGFILLVVAYLPYEYLAQGEPSYGDALNWSIERMFVEPYRGLQLYFEVYPNYHPFLYGLSSRAVAAVLNVRDFISVSVYIPQVFLGINNTSYPALFIGEAWADFGYVGVIVYSVVVGFILQSYNVLYYNQQRHYLEDAALLIAVGISTIHLGHSNLVATCFTYGLGTHVLICVAMKRLGRSREKVPRSALRIGARRSVLNAT